MSDKELIWNETERKELYKTPVFTVTERTSIGPDGQTGKFIVNECRDWGIVIPVIKDQFLMVKQWRHGEKKLSLEFPGGVIEKDELPEDGARRELLEETGASAGKLTFLGKINPNPALFCNHVYIYCAEDLALKGEQHLDEDEFVQYLKIEKKEVFAKIGTPDYPHALMASAVALYRAHYNE
ncbi:MAG: NUDIX hydrolase [Treponema sp.]|nr:NUDIX hydrolase [Treponema sp.]